MDPRYTLDTARAAAADDDLAAWVAGFLASPGSDNAALGEALAARDLQWIGPVRLPIGDLQRLAGPPGDPVLVEVDEEYWRDDVAELSEKVADDEVEPPPVVVTHAPDGLKLEDGNHRVEALRQAGEDDVWAVVGFEDVAERDQFLESAADVADAADVAG